jgi:ApaG protein
MKDSVIITTKSVFLDGQSNVNKNRFVFSYTITIENVSEAPFQLISRHWIVKDNNQKVDEIYGDGVIGEQPVILPKQSYTYSSGAVLETEMGTMEGRYFMLSDSVEFEVIIPKFLLSVPRTLH